MILKISLARGARGRAARAVLSLLLVLPAMPSGAAAIRVGETLPSLQIRDLGECMLRGDDVAFEPWDSSGLGGALQLVEYVAARVTVSSIHAPVYDAIESASVPAGALVVTKLVNADDALWGTAGLVPGKVGDNKRENPDIHLVVDTAGAGLRRWQLEEGSGALALVDRDGKVLFFKEHGLTEDEIATLVRLVRERLP